MGLFSSRSSSASSTQTQTTTKTSTVGADNGAISAKDSTVNILDGGVFGFAEKNTKEQSKNFSSMLTTLKSVFNSALSSNKSVFNSALSSNKGVLKESLNNVKALASQSVTKANERPGENPTKWILGAAAVVGVAMVFKK